MEHEWVQQMTHQEAVKRRRVNMKSTTRNCGAGMDASALSYAWPVT